MADGHHFEKSKNGLNSAMVRSIAVKFGNDDAFLL